jgi:hypothetical protein
VTDVKTGLKDMPDPSKLPGLSPEERRMVTKLFSSPMDIPPEWKAWLVSFLEANPPLLPISQIHGFSDFTATYQETADNDAITVANTWQTLAHSGPDIAEVPKGRYIILYGCNYDATGGATGFMGPVFNGAASPSVFVEIVPVNVERFILMRANLVDLTEDANTVGFKYQASQVGPKFASRWTIILKYANL